MGVQDMSREEILEKALYRWINETQKFENAVYQLEDKKKLKKDLIKISAEVKRKFRYLENIIKFY